MGAFLKIGHGLIPRLSSALSVTVARDQILSDLANYSAASTIFYPNQDATVDAFQAISSSTDQGSLGNTIAQVTAANRPFLSRDDNKENATFQSNDFSTWTNNTITVTNNSTTDPFGGSAGARLTRGSIAANLSISQTFQAGRWISETYFKAGTLTSVDLSFYQGTEKAVTVEIVSGPGSVSVVSNIARLSGLSGSEWTRIRVTMVAAHTATLTHYIYPGTVTATSNGTYLFVYNCEVRNYGREYLGEITTTYPKFAGINSKKIAVFDASNDGLNVSTLSVNPTGGMWATVAIRPFGMTLSPIMSCRPGSASNRFIFYLAADGSIVVRVDKSTTDYIQQATAAGEYTAGELMILTFKYDGTTAASGITIFKNGVQLATSSATGGAYTVPTAGDILKIGVNASGGTFNGAFGFGVFGQGSQLSEPNRAAWEAFATYAFTGEGRPFVTVAAASDQTDIQNLFQGGSTVFWQSSASTTINKSTIDITLPSSVDAQAVNYIAVRGLNLLTKAGSGLVEIYVRGSTDAFVSSDVELLYTSVEDGDLVGPNLEDHLYEGTLSSTYKYFRIEIITENAIPHRLRKLYIGELFDFGGKSPYYPYTPGYGENGSPFTSDSGSMFITSMGRRGRRLQFSWRGITDASRIFFDKFINRYLTNWPIFLYQPAESDHEPLSGDTVVFGYARGEVGTKDWKNNNQIGLSFIEDIVG